jgi:hypothetical protein
LIVFKRPQWGIAVLVGVGVIFVSAWLRAALVRYTPDPAAAALPGRPINSP